MSTTSTIHSLPGEVLQEIFTFHLLLYIHRIPELYVERNALRLTCYRWNAIIECTPAFWLYIMIALTDLWSCNPFVPTLQQWISRSGQMPLHVKIYCSSGSDARYKLLEEYLDVLGHAIHRWKDFHLGLSTVPIKISSRLLTKCPFRNADTLERFFVRLPPSVGEPSFINPIARSIGEIPNLRHLGWDFREDFKSAQALLDHVALTGLTGLTLSGFLLDQILTIASHTSFLTHLQIRVTSGHSHRELRTFKALTLPHLCSLDMTINGNNYFILHILNAPFLEVLSITVNSRPRDAPQPNSQFSTILPRYLASSPHSLKVIMLYDIEFSDIVPLVSDPHVGRVPVLEMIYREFYVDNVKKASKNAKNISVNVLDQCTMTNYWGESFVAIGWIEPSLRELFDATPDSEDPAHEMATIPITLHADRWRRALI